MVLCACHYLIYMLHRYGVNFQSHKKTFRKNNLKSDKHLISPYKITSDSHIQVTGLNKGNYHQLIELMIVKQSLLVSTMGNV